MAKSLLMASAIRKNQMRSLDTKAARGLIALNDTVNDLGAEVKVGLAGFALGALADAFDLDVSLGVEGIDAAVDKTSDVLLLGVATAATVKFFGNFKKSENIELMTSQEFKQLVSEIEATDEEE
jgi:hypothetical protein